MHICTAANFGRKCTQAILVQARKAKGRRAARSHVREVLSGCFNLLGEPSRLVATAVMHIAQVPPVPISRLSSAPALWQLLYLVLQSF